MMENGHEHRLAEKFSGLAVADSTSSASLLAAGGSSNNDHLFQVMKAVDAAEATIKQQDEENRRLRSELMKKMQELEKYKFGESMAERSSSVDQWDELDFHQSDPQISNREDKVNRVGNNSAGTLVLHQNFKPNREESALQSHLENGTWNVPPGSRARTTVENAGVSQSSSPSASIPRRYQIEGDYEARLNMPGHSLQMAEGDHSSSLWKQNIAHKIREHEDEILQLRKILSDYSVKEAQIRNEKCILEKRIAHMRLAFDQQQQDLVDAASKALSYRQDVMEENIRLSYELQAAQQERTMFVSSLLPLLTEYSLQPPVPDAQSIVSSVKVLFRHLQEKLNFTESKLKESQYQLAPWLQDGNTSNLATHSPARTMGMEMHKNGLELVPQPAIRHGIMPLNPNNPQAAEWDALSHRQSVIDGLGPKGFESAETGRYSALESRSTMVQDIPEQSAAARDARYEETPSKQVMFRDPVSNTEMEPEAERLHNDRDHYSAPTDDPNVPYPYLPPVLEEPSSSFSEAADDEPLPAIEDLQISGEAVPGRELLACGFSIKGTTSCNFEWVRHMEDGSVNYIEGAKQPNYLVTADDVDTYLAIEVQPLDDRKRKGELVKVFANEHRKITCDTEMQNHIERTLYSGHVSYRVSVATGYLDIWEPGILAIKREGYSIKCSGSTGVLVTEKFSPNINVAVPYGQPTEFIITDSSGAEHLLRADDNSTEISSWRDAIVLTLRLFIIRAGEKRKGRKRGIFFK